MPCHLTAYIHRTRSHITIHPRHPNSTQAINIHPIIHPPQSSSKTKYQEVVPKTSRQQVRTRKSRPASGYLRPNLNAVTQGIAVVTVTSHKRLSSVSLATRGIFSRDSKRGKGRRILSKRCAIRCDARTSALNKPLFFSFTSNKSLPKLSFPSLSFPFLSIRHVHPQPTAHPIANPVLTFCTQP
jgi:hypothetical protein